MQLLLARLTIVISFVVMVLAGLGFSLALIGILLSYDGLQLFGGFLDNALFIGMFVVWLPTVLVSSRMVSGANNRDFWKIILSGCPPWMRYTLYTLMGFGVLNFVSVVSGFRPHATTLAFAGGHLLIFYGIAFATMYSVQSSPWLLEIRRCPNGHKVSSVADFCSECGAPLTAARPPGAITAHHP